MQKKSCLNFCEILENIIAIAPKVDAAIKIGMELAGGMCAIYRFLKMGISACKIVGRSDDWENICTDIKAVYENIQIAKDCKSEEEYKKNDFS